MHIYECINVFVHVCVARGNVAVWGSGGMRRRVQLELNAPCVNWPILQSQPLECVLSDGTYPLSSFSFSLSQSLLLSLSLSLSLGPAALVHPLIHSLSHTHTHALSLGTHTNRHEHTRRHTPSLSLSHSLSHLIWSLVHSSFHSFSRSLCRCTLHRLTFTNSSSLSLFSLLHLLLACFPEPSMCSSNTQGNWVWQGYTHNQATLLFVYNA